MTTDHHHHHHWATSLPTTPTATNHLGTTVNAEGTAATADTVPAPNASLSSPEVGADRTVTARGLPPPPSSLTLGLGCGG